MKNLFLILLLAFVANHAYGASTPIKVDGIEVTKISTMDAKSVNRGRGEVVLSDSGLIFDGGFESATAFQGHTIVSGATYFSVVTAASDVLDGKKTARVTCFNAAPSGVCKIEQTVNLGTFRLNGFPMLLSVRVESSPDQPLTFCAKIDGVEKDCVTGYKGYLTIPTQAGSTSVGYTLSKNEYVSPLTSLFDSIKVEITETVTNAPVITPWKSYTPTFLGFGTPTSIDCKCRQNGGNQEIMCRFNAGTVSGAAQGRVSLCDGVTSSDTSVIGTLFKVGDGVINDLSASDRTVFIGPNRTYVTFGITSVAGANPLVERVGSEVVSTSGTLVFEASVPVAQYQASVPTYSDRCRDPRNCETVFSLESSSAGVASKISTTSATPWASCSKVSTGLYDCSVSALNNTLPMNCQSASLQYLNSTTIVSAGTSATNVRINTFDSSSETDADSSFTLVCQRQGQDYINAKVNQIVGSFKDYVKTEGTATGRVDFFMFSFQGSTLGTDCTSSPCAVDQIGDYVSSVTRTTTGNYVMNVKRTYTKLKCVSNSQSTGFAGLSPAPISCNNCSSLSGLVVRRWDNASFVDGFGNVSCQGTY